MLLKNLKNQKIRFFLMQSNDTWLLLFKEFYFWYLLSLLIDKLWFNLHLIEAEIVYPFNKYLDQLYEKLEYLEEEVFIFYLENAYHSNNYSYDFVVTILDRIEEQPNKPKVILHSMKMSSIEAKALLQKYNFVELIIRTDVEYFFLEYFQNQKELESITNIVYRSETTSKIITTKKESVDYNLEEYIFGWHYHGYLNKFSKSKDYIINLLDEDNIQTNESISYLWPKNKKITEFRYESEASAMISTWRGCKYNCSYCYRWSKYSKVRQIPLDVIKRDLDYLKKMHYNDIYLYDDCFLTTNYDRLDVILELLWGYDFEYGISIRYEMCVPEIFKKLEYLNLYRVQVGLQSISIDANKNTNRFIHIWKFSDLVENFRARWVLVSIDLILWLPWETLKDFIATLNYAIKLNPWSIHINTLFLNPGTELTQNKEIYAIKTNKSIKSLFSVPRIVSSQSFSSKEILLAKEYVSKVMKKIQTIKIILR